MITPSPVPPFLSLFCSIVGNNHLVSAYLLKQAHHDCAVLFLTRLLVSINRRHYYTIQYPQPPARLPLPPPPPTPFFFLSTVTDL